MMNTDTHCYYGLMFDERFVPTHTRADRIMAKNSNVMPMRNFMGLITIIAHYANLIAVAGYNDYKRVDMGQNAHRYMKVLAKDDFFDIPTITDPCSMYSMYEVKDKTIESHTHDFTLWIGSDLDGLYRVCVAVCDTTIYDMNRGHEYENVLYYSGMRYVKWSE